MKVYSKAQRVMTLGEFRAQTRDLPDSAQIGIEDAEGLVQLPQGLAATGITLGHDEDALTIILNC